MNLIFVAAEVAPWSKTGGLGDVVGGLPIELAKRGHHVITIAPRCACFGVAAVVAVVGVVGLVGWLEGGCWLDEGGCVKGGCKGSHSCWSLTEMRPIKLLQLVGPLDP